MISFLAENELFCVMINTVGSSAEIMLFCWANNIGLVRKEKKWI